MRNVFLCVAAFAISLIVPDVADAAGPSFDCAKVTSAVNKLICVTPSLAALDAKLAQDLDNTRFQAGIDAKKLHSEEDVWLKSVRDTCATVACLTAVYQYRDAAILDESRQAASPASYAETQPFAVDAARWAEAQSLIGKSCASPRALDRSFPGYASPRGFESVVLKEGVVVPEGKAGTRFAFLVQLGGMDHSCKIMDVVALPDAGHANTFLECVTNDMTLTGFGMRRVGQKGVVGFWTIEDGKIKRQPVGVLGGNISCEQPESGD